MGGIVPPLEDNALIVLFRLQNWFQVRNGEFSEMLLLDAASQLPAEGWGRIL
jgi:hypothetical protein